MIMNIPALKIVLAQIQKAAARDYKEEYRRDHSSSKQIAERSQRNQARAKLGLKVGDKREVDHKRPISQGGTNNKRNLRAVSRSTNRSKGAKTNNS